MATPGGKTRIGPRRDRALYVEISIRASLETVWELTQDPHRHVRWDARFSVIRPVRLRLDGAQEFEYERGLGLHTIRGTGVSLGTRNGGGGERTSALVFDSRDRLSPLRKGRGYWRYIPTSDGVRFLTGFDYEPGWGALGRVLDPLLVRPFVWWLTARSFDRLRLWAEEGVAPERTAWWRALRPGPRPRARRCLSRPPVRGSEIMRDAPPSLAGIER
ncbi:SRPBCC family protein [Microbacterium capsulatum]|uniref:SRPBCC family protein n=1 Tax=Microbacterium capsulatum TaxID=3041921 RepID=A0ABU0XIY5_9MICO|nr:SRPBCC family protein [Microbacterium sp. ASV81]MDQ4214533.1 SRPBCC family protein [Microbacterium sp. ASV81]